MPVAGLFKAVATTGVGALFLGYIGVIKPLKYYGRLAVYVLCVVLGATYGVVLSILLAPIGKRRLVQHLVARFFYTLCHYTLGYTIIFKNEKVLLDQRPVMVISNHQSMLDVLVLGRLFPPYCSVTAKTALKWYPFLGWFMWASGSVFINRANRKNAFKAFEDAQVVVQKEKQSVFMFPEGTRSHTTKLEMLPFKKGAFHFAIQCQMPIVPIVVANYSKLWSQPNKHIQSGTIVMEALEPIPTAGLTAADVNALLEKTRAAMDKAQHELGYAQVANP